MHNENITIQKIFKESLAISNGERLIAPLGIKENGEIEYVDYSKINHLIVCGTSGSGKTTFVRTLLASLMSVSSPDSVKFCIFDSKHIDYTDLNGMPFLLLPVTTDSKKCSSLISWVTYEAERRQKFFADARNTDESPDIFVVLDDYAEIPQHQDTQGSLYKLLQIAHRVKIHVIIVTSIALATIVSTELKVNIPHRISFFLPERRNSQVVIDQDGAETLEFPGEFIAKFYNKTKTLRSIELTDSEIKEFFDTAKVETNYSEDILCEIERQASIQKKTFDIEELDSLYNDAIQIVLKTGVVSASLLQRNLKIGYARATRIIDQMEEKGIIGPSDGTAPHKVLINN